MKVLEFDLFDGDAAARNDVGRDSVRILDGVPTIAEAVVDARFAGGPLIVDTTTVNGVRAVTLEVPGQGPLPLLPSEALTLARALLSRLAVVGFPEEPAPAETATPEPEQSRFVMGFACPCGVRWHLFAEDDRDAFERDVAEHSETCRAVA